MKVKKYKILMVDHPRGLKHEVQKYIEKGWQPYGDMAIDGVNMVCMQTMVLYEEEPPASNFQFDKHGCLIIRACGEDPQASD